MNEQTETATIGGGCFWCTEAVFQRLKGVRSVVPGYAGGQVANPSYSEVCSGNTGHAEAIQIEFDPRAIAFEALLEIFWHTHDPTTRNQQGADFGTQYRSVIFYHSDQQRDVAERAKAALGKSGLFAAPIVTDIEPFTNFYEAEDYHKNYYDTHGSAGYCTVVIDPKIDKLMAQYSDTIKDEYKP